MWDFFAGLPTDSIQTLSTASMEQLLAAGLTVIVFALGFQAGNTR